uniref:Uncharacterized protein n=1 Tax=Arundo donax TaxID=35708 RepID=A0A0A8ZPE6_ARUDO
MKMAIFVKDVSPSSDTTCKIDGIPKHTRDAILRGGKLGLSKIYSAL